MKTEIFSKVVRKSTLLVLVLCLVVGGVVWTMQGSGQSEKETNHGTTYTCSMHPQVKQEHPGRCPICGMDLIPLKSKQGQEEGTHQHTDGVMMSEEALALANVETQVVGEGGKARTVRLFGRIVPNERTQQTQSAYVEGRVERLFVSAVGDRVHKGQTLAVIYSPSLYTASQELLAAMRWPEPSQRQNMIAAAREKLALLNVTEKQMSKIMASHRASALMEIKANTTGTVVEQLVKQGDYVKQGQPLMRIANLSSVWAVFQAYEEDLPLLHVGMDVHFTAEALPGKSFHGKIQFVDPVMDAKSRTAGVRVVVANGQGLFRPEMTLTGEVSGGAAVGADEVVVPRSAVLWTGKRSVVYVKDEEGGMPIFRLREVTLGATTQQGYVVTDGLSAGEEVVTQGAFAVDASAQLDGQPSAMEH